MMSKHQNNNNNNYESILPTSTGEHEPLVPRLLEFLPEEPERRYGKACEWATGLVLLLGLVVGMNYLAFNNNDHRHIVDHPVPIVVLEELPMMDEEESHFEQMEDWKGRIHEFWGPFMVEAKQQWAKRKGEQQQVMSENEMEEWQTDFSQAAVMWWWKYSAAAAHAVVVSNDKGWNEVTEATASNYHSGEWINDERNKSGQWIQNEETKTDQWFHENEHKSSKWIQDEGTRAGEWFNNTEQALHDDEKHTGEWFKDEEHKSAEWFKDEEHKTAGWFNKTEHKSGDWFKDEEHKTTAFFNKSEHEVGDFFTDETHKTEQWFNGTEHKSADWFHKEGEKISDWFKKEEHKTQDWFHHKINESEEWWNETHTHEKDWWYNTTHKPLPEFVVYMNQTSAYRMLTNGIGFIDYAQDYFAIQQGLDAQINQAYCAVATSVAILNSLRGSTVKLPVDPIYDPYPYATQYGVVLNNECTNQHVIHVNETFDGIRTVPGGLGMAQTKALLECHLDTTTTDDWNITVNHLDPTLITLNEFRKDLQDTLHDPSGRVMINYDRKLIAGQIGGGHWSPIGAYSPHMDAFLVMDVAKYKYPNAWISTSLLYNSLQSYDSCGTWDFPMAQSQIPTKKKKLHDWTPIDTMNAMVILGCEPTRRGYITVKKKTMM